MLRHEEYLPCQLGNATGMQTTSMTQCGNIMRHRRKQLWEFSITMSLGIHPHHMTNQLDISGTYDGTCRKRGHTSNISVGFVIEQETGVIIDFDVLCNFCSVCASKQKQNLSQKEWDLWFEGHKANCHKSFDGTSAAMEAAAAVKLWT